MFVAPPSTLAEKFEYKWQFDWNLEDSNSQPRSPEFSMAFLKNSSHLKAKHDWARRISIYFVSDGDSKERVQVEFRIKRGCHSDDVRTGTFLLGPWKNFRENSLGSFECSHVSGTQAFTFHVTLYSCITTTESIRCRAKVNLSNDVLKTFQTAIHTDVVLDVGGDQFPAHKAILSARSSVFAAMFNHDMVENKSGRVEIKDISHSAVKELLNFMYGAEISSWNDEVAEELMVASNKYAVSDLFETCENFLITELTESNAVRFLDMADVHRAAKLKESALEFICKNLEHFKDPTKMELLDNKTDLLKEVIAKIACHVTKRC